MKLRVLCLRWNDYYPEEYVANLESMVKRNLKMPHTFHCLRGSECINPVEGWWHRLQHFLTPGPWIQFDLDVVITGNLDRLVEFGEEHDKPSTIDDWNLENCYNSSVIYCPSGYDGEQLFKSFDPVKDPARLRDDQRFMWDYDNSWPTFPDGWCNSYKTHYRNKDINPLLYDTSVVVFHGKPKPHECQEEWVKNNWK